MDVMKKLEALQNVAEFEQEMSKVGSPEELQVLFKKHGVDLTNEELNSLLAKVSAQDNDELSDTDLDDVAGGVIWPMGLYRIIYKWILKNGRWLKVAVRK